MNTITDIDGDALRTMRINAGLTLADMAELTNLSYGYVAQLERGDKPLNDRLITRILSAYFKEVV